MRGAASTPPRLWAHERTLWQSTGLVGPGVGCAAPAATAAQGCLRSDLPRLRAACSCRPAVQGRRARRMPRAAQRAAAVPRVQPQRHGRGWAGAPCGWAAAHDASFARIEFLLIECCAAVRCRSKTRFAGGSPARPRPAPHCRRGAVHQCVCRKGPQLRGHLGCSAPALLSVVQGVLHPIPDLTQSATALGTHASGRSACCCTTSTRGALAWRQR